MCVAPFTKGHHGVSAEKLGDLNLLTVYVNNAESDTINRNILILLTTVSI
eukprot:m.136163 g.136163  ORF g.136163 m.136163 type:complete len:50 (-) comp14724_c0_seq7:137-286(-)